MIIDEKIEYCRCGDSETIKVTRVRSEGLKNLHVKIDFGPENIKDVYSDNIDIKTDIEELRTMINKEISRLVGKE